MQPITSYNSHHNTSQEIRSSNSYRQFTKHLACNKHMPTFTYVKAIQMQRKHFEINSYNNKTHIAALGNQISNTQAKFAKQYNFGKLLGRWHAFKLN